MSDLVLPEPLLELRGVRAAYGTIEVLHGVDLQVPAGTVTGPSMNASCVGAPATTVTD